MPVHSGLCREAPGASSGPAANSGLLDPSHFGVSVKRLLPVVASYFPTQLVVTKVTMPVAGSYHCRDDSESASVSFFRQLHRLILPAAGPWPIQSQAIKYYCTSFIFQEGRNSSVDIRIFISNVTSLASFWIERSKWRVTPSHIWPAQFIKMWLAEYWLNTSRFSLMKRIKV